MRMRTRRKAASITQEQLAQALDLSCQQVQKYERGENRISASTLFVASTFLGVPVSYFFEGYDMAASASAGAVADKIRIADFWQSADGRLIADVFPRILDLQLRKHFLGLLRVLAGKSSPDRDN